MTEQELQKALMENPWPLFYGAALLAGSLISLILVLRWRSRQHSLAELRPIPPWPIGGLDFGLFLVSLILWFILSGAVLAQFAGWLYPENSPGPLFTVFGGLFLQAGMLVLFLRFRLHFRSPVEGPLSPRIFSSPQAVLAGLMACLASLPVVYAIAAAWNGFLEFLRNRGFDIDLPLQDAVLLFQETGQPLVLLGLLFLAVIVAPVVEELVFRAGIYRFLKGRIPVSAALLISGALFGVIHGNLQSLPGLVAVGVCLGLAYEWSGNLRVPIAFHAFFNLNSIIWIQLLPEGLT